MIGHGNAAFVANDQGHVVLNINIFAKDISVAEIAVLVFGLKVKAF